MTIMTFRFELSLVVRLDTLATYVLLSHQMYRRKLFMQASKAKQATVIRLEMFFVALHHSAFLSILLPRFQIKNRLLWMETIYII